jgi:class 3 adenylate cyclase/CHASE2 domain-containing sensor protein
VLAWTGITHSLQDAWRGQAIGIARLARSITPESTNPSPPLCILFARFSEDYRDAQPVEGRYSDSPDEAVRRLALLLAALAALPADQRPSAIGVDMVLPEQEEPRPSEPYLAAAIAELGRVILSATEEPGPDGSPAITLPSEPLKAVAHGVGLDTYPLPPWSNPASRPRLYIPMRGIGDGGIRGLAVEVAELAAPGSTTRFPSLQRLPIRYPNLYEPRLGKPDGNAPLLGLWPATRAADYIAEVPPWEAEELPEAWLARVRAILNEPFEDSDPNAPFVWTPVSLWIPELAQRVVLIGVGQPDDLLPTPFTRAAFAHPTWQLGRAPRTPGVAVHAVAVNTLIRGLTPWEWSSRSRPTWWLALVFAAFLGWFIGFRVPLGTSLALGGASVVVLFVADVVAMEQLNVWLDSLALLVVLLAFQIAASIEQQRLLVRSRLRIQQWVQRLTPAVSASVISAEEEDYLSTVGGVSDAPPRISDWRTVVRTDLAGYTPMNRELELIGRPDLMVSLMTDYFRRAVEAVERTGGELSDLTGDGLVAFFNEEDDALEAEHAAEAARELARVGIQWRESWARTLETHGLSRIPLPGVRVAVGASETSFQMVGTERQKRTLFFGGAFITSARIEAAIKNLPLPPNANPRARVAFDEASAGFLLKGRLGANLHRHNPILVQGLDRPIVVYEWVDPLGDGLVATC